MTTGTKTSGVIPGLNYPPNTPFSFGYREWVGDDGRYNADGSSKCNTYVSVRQLTQGVTCTNGQYFGASGRALSDPWTSEYTNRIQNKLLLAIKGHQFHLGISLAESKQAANMVFGNLAKIGGALVSVKRGDLSSAARSLGVKRHTSKLRTTDIAGRWLELQYGWLPLVNDVYNAMQAYAVIGNARRVWTVSVEQSTGFRQHNYTSVSGGVLLWSGVIKTRARGRLTYQIVEELGVARSLGLEDPMGVAWELIPYSFVIDWFIPISTYLENLNAIPKLTGASCFSRFYTKSEVIRAAPKNAANELWGYHGGRTRYEASRTTRSPTLGLQLQAPSFVGLDQVFSPKRLANALALVAQRVLVAKPPRVTSRAINPGSISGGKSRHVVSEAAGFGDRDLKFPYID